MKNLKFGVDFDDTITADKESFGKIFRVLQEAGDVTVPLLDRMRFLGIFSNNLDEFFRVRFAAIRRLTLTGISGEKYFNGISSSQLLHDITEIVIDQQAESLEILNDIEARLEKENIFTIDENDVTPDQELYLKDFFVQKVSPELVTIILNDLDHFPVLKDTSGYLAVKLVINGLADEIEKPSQSATAVVQKMELFVPLKGLIDLDQEMERLSKRMNELSGHLENTEKKLANKNFVDRAPDNVVKHENQKLQDMTAEFNLVKANLDMLQ